MLNTNIKSSHHQQQPTHSNSLNNNNNNNKDSKSKANPNSVSSSNSSNTKNTINNMSTSLTSPLLLSSLPSSSLAQHLRVVTLNIWGINFVSKDVSFRIKNLIEALNDANYDIISLQEVWSQRDFIRIRDGIKSKYPYSHYFQSGFIGSGCCVFSQHAITATFYHIYSVNGYFHQIHRGDWFGEKLVGLAVVDYFGININVYVTHLHANYADTVETDSHRAHRYAQLLELGQFINLTSGDASLSLLTGDLNTCDDEPGFQYLLLNSNLFDSFQENSKIDSNNNKNTAPSNSCTCHAPTNIYSKTSRFPDGLRIDYILFKGSSDVDLKCVTYEKCLGKIQSASSRTDKNYSDHEGVFAEFQLTPKPQETELKRVRSYHPDAQNHLNETRTVIKNKVDSIGNFPIFCLFLAFVLGILLFFFNEKNEYLVLFKNVVLSLLIVLFGLYFPIIMSIEKKRLNGVLSMCDVLNDRHNTKQK